MSKEKKESEMAVSRNIMRRFTCFLFGHKKAVPMLNEDENYIFTKGCPRCKEPLGWCATWKSMPHPPNSTPEQLQSWKDYLEQHWKEVRASVNGA